MKLLFLSLLIAATMPCLAQSYDYSVGNVTADAFRMTGCKDGSVLLTAMRFDTIPSCNIVLKVKPNGDPLFCRRQIPSQLRETSTGNVFGTAAPASAVYFYDKNLNTRWYMSLRDLTAHPTDNAPIIRDVLELEPNRFLISAVGFDASYAKNGILFVTVDTLGTILNAKSAPLAEDIHFIAKSGPSIYCMSNDKLFKYNMAANLIEPLFRSDTTLAYNQPFLNNGLLLPGKKMLVSGYIAYNRNLTNVQGLIACFDSTGVCLWKKAIPASSGSMEVRSLCFASNANDILVTCSESPRSLYFKTDSLGNFHDIVETTSWLLGGVYFNNQAYFYKWSLGLSITDANGFIGCSQTGSLSTTIPPFTNGGGTSVSVSSLSYTNAVSILPPEPYYTVTKTNTCGGTIGILETEMASNDLILFPNPASTALNITLASDAQDITAVEILNYAGQQIFISKQAERIDIARLPAGYYFVRIHTATGIYAKRFIKD